MTALLRTKGVTLLRLVGLTADAISRISIHGLYDPEVEEVIMSAHDAVRHGEGSSVLWSVASNIDTGRIICFWCSEYL